MRHGDPDIGERHRGNVVDAVAGHDDRCPPLFAARRLQLAGGPDPGTLTLHPAAQDLPETADLRQVSPAGSGGRTGGLIVAAVDIQRKPGAGISMSAIPPALRLIPCLSRQFPLLKAPGQARAQVLWSAAITPGSREEAVARWALPPALMRMTCADEGPWPVRPGHATFNRRGSRHLGGGHTDRWHASRARSSSPRR